MAWHGETTGIGSLPHQSIDAALDFSFAHDVPFLPQLPMGHPEEGMLALAASRLLAPNERAWPAFLERLDSLRPRTAKVQIAGPIVASRAEPFAGHARLTQKALLLAEGVQRAGVTPMIFLDEPWLVGADGASVPLDALSDLLTSLAGAGALTGVHCCGRADWARVLALPSLDVLSFDFRLSGAEVLPGAEGFIERGGTLAFGIDVAPLGPERAMVAAKSWLLTTSCGLVGSTVAAAEAQLTMLTTLRAKLAEAGATHDEWPREK